MTVKHGETLALFHPGPAVRRSGVISGGLWRRPVANGVWTWLYWPITGCIALGYFLAWYWRRKQQLGLKVDFTPPLHWTDRDQNAWKLVEARAKASDKLPPDKVTDFQFYIDTAKDMAQELAAFYHPGARIRWRTDHSRTALRRGTGSARSE